MFFSRRKQKRARMARTQSYPPQPAAGTDSGASGTVGGVAVAELVDAIEGGKLSPEQLETIENAANVAVDRIGAMAAKWAERRDDQEPFDANLPASAAVPGAPFDSIAARESMTRRRQHFDGESPSTVSIIGADTPPLPTQPTPMLAWETEGDPGADIPAAVRARLQADDNHEVVNRAMDDLRLPRAMRDHIVDAALPLLAEWKEARRMGSTLSRDAYLRQNLKRLRAEALDEDRR